MSEINGYVDHIIFRNDENGYTILILETENEEVTVVGTFRTIEEGEMILVRGEFVTHSAYGLQFKMSDYEVKIPEDVVSIERYLSSGAIKGIGVALAKRIVKKFGEETFRIMEEEPERLAEVKGISERISREISAQMEEKKDMRKAMIFLQQYGISMALAVRIYNTYQKELYQVIKENPYRMTEEIVGIGFKTADEIAEKVGIHMDSDFRIRSGILYCLAQATAEGNVYFPKQIIIDRAAKLLQINENHIENQLDNLAIEHKIFIKQMNSEIQVYPIINYYTELNCARKLLDLDVEDNVKTEYVIQKIGEIEKCTELILEDRQRESVVQAVKNGVLVITGGPGTGKTTTINMLIHYFVEEGLDIVLAAPTGRAAKRMTETTGYEAKTIHRLLELNGGNRESNTYTQKEIGSFSFERNENNPIESDVIIVDEMSMVDIFLFHALLQAIIVGTKLILVGDVNQLPSVGPGCVLKDIINSEKFAVVELEKIFRQAATSDIIMNAHKINAGQNISLNNDSKDFFFLERMDAEVIVEAIVYLVTKKLPPYVQAEPFDIQVMTPMRKGILGVENLNKCLQQRLNPHEDGKKEKEFGDRIFRMGDKVMQIKNDYQLEWETVSKYGITIDKGLGVFNGDMGIIMNIDENAEIVTILFDECKQVKYPYTQLDELELSYAITIHKSQGSEYPAVVIPILSGPAMLLNRNLLYTGITRAKKCVTLLGSSDTVSSMINNQSEQVRYTGFEIRIRELEEEI
ncbi:MAG: ATP-dependent RecD-like DNA helicase [Lachnospiraceae bacterium]|nr:ATP-dependent RecD-like DNA helicase [Lachnospiraceae bacterium]